MEPVRIGTLLDAGWSLIGQLHQWLSTWPQAPYDREELVALVDGLQQFWVKAEDLELKRLARNSLALELFFERLCAKKLDVTFEYLKDVSDGVACFEDLLLALEATSEEPFVSDLDSLQRLEQNSLHGFSSHGASAEKVARTIEIPAVRGDSARSIISTPPIPIPIPIPCVEVEPAKLAYQPPLLEVQKVPLPETTLKRIEQPFLPLLPQIVVGFDEPSVTAEVSITEDVPLLDHEVGGADVDSNRVLIVEESLFYRHLIDVALQSAGYESEAVEPAVFSNADSALEPVLNHRAILITSSVSSMMTDLLQRTRLTGNAVVIGLKATDQDEQFGVELDACVIKSKPQQLISVLNQLLNSTASHTRRIA